MTAASGRRGLALALLLAALALAAAIYLPALSFRPFWDDYGQVTAALRYGFDVLADHEAFFRPLERLANTANTVLAPGDWRWSHGLSLLLLLASGGLMFQLMLRLFPGGWLTAGVAAALLLLHPLQVGSVVQIDTLSQLLCAPIALATMLVLAGPQVGRVAGKAGTVCLLTFLGMASKEAYGGFALAVPVIAVLFDLRQRPALDRGRAVRLVLVYATAVGVALAAYMALRFASGRGFGSAYDRYSVVLGANLVTNSVMLVGADLFPGSTVELLHNRNIMHAAISTLLLLPALVLTLVGLFGLVRRPAGDDRVRRRSDGLALAAFALAAVAGLVPTILPASVSEHQATLSLPFVIALLAVLARLALERPVLGRRPRPAAVGMLVAASLGWMAWAAAGKVALVGGSAARAGAIIDQVMAAFAAAPADADFVICHTPPEDQRMFGIYDLPAEHVIGTLIIWHLQELWPERTVRQAPAGDPGCSVTVATDA
jgi:hypothetical protein